MFILSFLSKMGWPVARDLIKQGRFNEAVDIALVSNHPEAVWFLTLHQKNNFQNREQFVSVSVVFC
jgi:hypothetical protein